MNRLVSNKPEVSREKNELIDAQIMTSKTLGKLQHLVGTVKNLRNYNDELRIPPSGVNCVTPLEPPRNAGNSLHKKNEVIRNLLEFSHDVLTMHDPCTAVGQGRPPVCVLYLSSTTLLYGL